MNNFSIRLLLSLLAGCFFAGSAVASTAEQRLFALLENLQSLQGQFQQRIDNEAGEVIQEASGELFIKRPGKLAWHTQAPYQHQVITDGETLWIYDLDLEQVTQQAFASNLDQAPALLLSGDTQAIAEQFVIAEDVIEGVQTFSLQPRGDGSVFSAIEMHFTDAALQMLVLKDNFGQRTEISFRNLVINQSIAVSHFQFTPPEGVDLIINDR